MNGFHKRGFMVGIGTQYPLSNSINLGIGSTFYRHGSKRKNRDQDKLPEGIQLEMGLSTIGLEFSTLFTPVDRSFFYGLGIVYHHILDFDYKIVDNIVSGPARLLESEYVSSSFYNAKFFLGWSFASSYKFTISHERALSNILKEDFLNISLLKPYLLSFTFSYEWVPGGKKIKVKNKIRKAR